jgi:YfiH family protein
MPADIIVNADPSLAIAVQGADCVPLLIADPESGAVAAAHAGWRGMSRRVPSVAVAAMASMFGSRPASLRVALGPSVGACCYEVGPDVRGAFAAAGFDDRDLGRWFFDAPRPTPANPSMPSVAPGRRPGRWFFDGSASVRDQLLGAGVLAGHIWAAGLCTASHPGVFCSYRRDGPPAGRMAAVIVPSSHRP